MTKGGVCKLGDFGVAKCLANTNSMARTQTGTPYYLSPEIFNDETYGASSDMWSLGVVLFEITTLKLPFQAPDPASDDGWRCFVFAQKK